MNFLAHLHLSDGTPESMVGNVVADFVKGPDVAALPAAVQKGVHLHRAVDSFTDRHPMVQRSIRRLGGKLGWFAGIVIDIYYDHILARNWVRYSTEPLRAFADRCNRVLLDWSAAVPAEAGMFLRRYVAEDRLFIYATPAGIADTLAAVSRRIADRMPKRDVRLHDAMPDLLAADTGLAADFHAFYPELVAFATLRKAAAAG